jgi:hypothetical protein
MPAREVKTSPGWDNENLVPDELIARLYGKGEEAIVDAIAAFSPPQRANLAAFCYRKAHLHSTGLAIAATCDEQTLIQAHGTALGSILFAQSRDRSAEKVRVPHSHRPKVTLAQRPPQLIVASFDLDDEIDSPASSAEVPEAAPAVVAV